MNKTILSVAATLLLVPIAGCIGGGFDFEPGTGFKETNNTVHLRMWVEDMVLSDIYPGFKANLWAFCAEPANPTDEYSRKAIEYRNPVGTVQRVQPDGSMRVDEDATSKCSVPGPQLRIKQGDRVIVDFQNDHFHSHTIHWHGQFVPWESDGAPGTNQDSVVPGTSFRYDFIAKRAGTLWYHCHVDTQFHVMLGLYGVIIVEPQETKYEPAYVDREYTLVFGTLRRELVEFIPPAPGQPFNPHEDHIHGPGCGTSGNPNCQNLPVDVSPDTWMLNGRSHPNAMHDDQTLIHLKEGERVRLRILNAGETFETLHPHGHDMYVTHRDGNPLPPGARFWVDTLSIGPAERYDVIIEGNNPGPWMMHTHVASQETNDGAAPGGAHTMILYEGFEDRMHSFQAELPAGRMVRYPVQIPADLLLTQLVPLPNELQDAPLRDWTFPVRQPCAVERIHIKGALVPTNQAYELLTNVRASLLDPEGAVIFTTDLGGASGGVIDWTITETSPAWAVRDLVAGNFTIRLTGTAIDAALDLAVTVDYYPDLEAADYAALLNQREECGVIPAAILAQWGY